MNKTNVMRILETEGIAYTPHEYPVDENDLSGVHTAKVLGLPPEQLFKTLVLKGERTGLFVCCIPSGGEVDLKKAAKAAGDKAAVMLPMKELLPATGYIRGGCSPIGMKKRLPTFLDETSVLWDTVCVSAGTRGCMVELSPEALVRFLGAPQVDLLKE